MIVVRVSLKMLPIALCAPLEVVLWGVGSSHRSSRFVLRFFIFDFYFRYPRSLLPRSFFAHLIKIATSKCSAISRGRPRVHQSVVAESLCDRLRGRGSDDPELRCA